MKFKFLALVIFAACLVANAANILVNGNFESQPKWGLGIARDSGYTLFTGTDIPGWVVQSGHAVTVHKNTVYPVISGVYGVNMDGEGYNSHNANFYQDFASTNWQAYRFEFDWGTWQSTSCRLDVSITDVVTSSVLYQGNFAWSSGTRHEIATFVGTGNTLRLRVRENPESLVNDNGFIVDNFSVEIVPEPTTTLMFILACACFIFLHRK
ncbi:MAG: DUF642 domain-containing protein [Candidatus Brocadiae bacterium]|nr:DUF642 domain-containing protein [Candidatus Brocadiia bacterium]